MNKNIPQIKKIMAHVKQQQNFLFANLNTSHSLTDEFYKMYQHLDNPVGILANQAMGLYYHDEKYTDNQGILKIVDYVFYTFKDIYDKTQNQYIHDYIKDYLYLCLYDNLHNLDACIHCRTLINRLL